jgi:hypothetical protein
MNRENKGTTTTKTNEKAEEAEEDKCYALFH